MHVYVYVYYLCFKYVNVCICTCLCVCVGVRLYLCSLQICANLCVCARQMCTIAVCCAQCMHALVTHFLNSSSISPFPLAPCLLPLPLSCIRAQYGRLAAVKWFVTYLVFLSFFVVSSLGPSSECVGDRSCRYCSRGYIFTDMCLTLFSLFYLYKVSPFPLSSSLFSFSLSVSLSLSRSLTSVRARVVCASDDECRRHGRSCRRVCGSTHRVYGTTWTFLACWAHSVCVYFEVL